MSWYAQDSNDNNTWKGSLMADSMGVHILLELVEQA